MLVNRVQAEFIGTNRIDPDYYQPEYLADEKCLRRFGSDELVTVGHFFAGPFGSKLPSDLYLSVGVPLFRVGNVGSMEVLLNGMAHLAPEVHEELNDSEVIPGDLLIVKASVGEKICRVPTWMPRANITQHIIGIRPNGNVDMDFVAAFLFCEYGRRQLMRRSLGSIIQYLGVTDAKDVLFPRISTTAQKFFGRKVRQSNRLREHAQTLKNDLAQRMAVPELIAACNSPDPRTNRVHADDLSDRLDSKYYGLRAMSVERAARNLNGGSLSALGPQVSNGFESREFVDHGRAYVTVSEVSSGRLSLESAPLLPFDVEIPEKATISAQCTLVVRTGSIGVAVKPHHEDSEAVISSHLIKLQFQSEAIAASVAVFLSSEAGKILQRKISYGAVQPQIGQDELLRLPIPQTILQQGADLSCLLNEYEASVRSAERLTICARLLIEALIERKVAAADFANIEEAVDRGDNSADRALLGRLTRQGIDVPGQPPLFPDLDALYALLAQTQEEPA